MIDSSNPGEGYLQPQGMVAICFVGFWIVEEQLEEYRVSEPRPQFAALRAQQGFMTALLKISKVVRFIASEPVSTWPKYRRSWIPKRRQLVSSGNSAIDINTGPSLNLPGVRLFMRSLVVGLQLFTWLGGNARADPQSESRLIVVYSLHFAHLLPAYINAKIFHSNIVVIIPDLPVYMNVSKSRGGIFGVMKALEQRLALACARRCDGQVVFTEHIARDFALGDNWMVGETVALPGLTDDVEDIPRHIEVLIDSVRASGKSIALYTGGISASYGVSDFFQAVVSMGGGFEAWVCGPGDVDALIDSDEMNECVRSLGVLDNRSVRALQSRVDVLVNLRPPGPAYTRYSFPSKLAEYMLSGTPVITTALEGIPRDYYPYCIVVDPAKEGSVVEALKFVRDSPNEASELGRKAEEFMLQTRGALAQARRISNLIFGAKERT